MTFWNLKNPQNNNAKLTMYGYIGRWMDIDERDFANQMKEVADKDLDIYVNSGGGSVFTAVAIYNILARHKGKITFYVDGIAASAATIITSVPGAKVVAPVGTMMMVHNPLLDPGGPVNAEEMRELAERLDKVGGSIVGIYEQKTKQPAEKLQELMDAETYMTATEAVEYGFADEVGQQIAIAASISRDRMTINGIDLDPSRHRNMPESFFTKPENREQPKGRDQTPGSLAGKTEEPKEPKPMTLEQLKAEHSELYAQIVAEGEKAGAEKERARIQNIEEMAMPGHEKLVTAAKFENPITAEQLAVEMLKAEKQSKQNFLNNRAADALDVEGVKPGAADDATNKTAEQKEREQYVAYAAGVNSQKKRSFLNRKEG